MVLKWISGDAAGATWGMPLRLAPALGLVLGLSACVTKAPVEEMSLVDTPPMQWDHHPEGEEWTDATLVALSTKDPILSERVPADIAEWCPAYPEAPVEARRAFWAGLMSAVARYESTWNPTASGGGGRWIAPAIIGGALLATAIAAPASGRPGKEGPPGPCAEQDLRLGPSPAWSKCVCCAATGRLASRCAGPQHFHHDLPNGFAHGNVLHPMADGLAGHHPH